MQTSSTVTTRRETLLKLLPSINLEKSEPMLRGLLGMSDRISAKTGTGSVVLMTMTDDITVKQINELFVGDDQDRVTVDGVHTMMTLYRSGFFTGKKMQEPKMVSRIAAHMQTQLCAA